MSKINYYWQRTARNMSWMIAYRDRSSDILFDKGTKFELLKLQSGLWGADPFVFSFENKTVLFFELFIEKTNKGVIAVSEYDGSGFSQPKIVIEEPYHLSFPCVFKMNGILYMIPESGSQYNIVLYECESYPYKWVRKKVLLEHFDSSDTIVFHKEGKTYLLASQLVNSTCIAKNVLFEIDPNSLELSKIKEGGTCSDYGIRNAGLLFSHNGKLIRPGQNCPDGEYGKSTIFWEVFNPLEIQEEQLCELTVDMLNIDLKNKFSGVHTYNQCDALEVIDLRIVQKNLLYKRLFLFANFVISFLKSKLR